MSSEKNFSLDEEVDLRKMLDAFLKNMILIVLVTSSFAMISIFYALSIPNQYQSSVVVAPINNDGSSLSSLGSSSIGGLASLAGINLSSEGVSESQIALRIMQSWSFIEVFIQKNNLSKYLIAAEGWDDQNDRMLFNPDVYDSKNEKWLINKPSSWSLYKSFIGRLSVQEDQKTGMTTITFKYYSPRVSKEIVELFIEDINQYMRSRKLEKVDKSIRYLQRQIDNSPIKEMANVFYQIIAEETKAKMLAEATPEYAFVTISRAMIPYERSEPTRSIIVIIWTIIGFTISLLAGLIKYHLDGFSLKPD